MEKIGAEVIMLVLLPLLLLQLSPLVSAVDFIFNADSSTACTGVGVICQGIPSGACCAPSQWAASVMVINADDSVYSHVSVLGACGDPQTAQTGQTCYNVAGYPGQLFSGATWSNSARRRSLLGALRSLPCETQMKPNGVVFTEDGTKGHWILTTSDADELHSQMLNVPDGGKVDWLISQGAIYNEL